MKHKEENMIEQELERIVLNALKEYFEGDGSFTPLDSLHDKVDKLIDKDNLNAQINLSSKIMDKFDGYMKNVDKLNMMINEFKGIVSMVRGESRGLGKEFKDLVSAVEDQSKEISKNIKKGSKTMDEVRETLKAYGADLQKEEDYKPRPKFKRDIFRLESDKPKAVNFDHVTSIELVGKHLIFSFYYGTSTFELADEEAAKSVFEQLLNVWAGEEK